MQLCVSLPTLGQFSIIDGISDRQ